VVPALNHRALLNKLLASALDGFADPLKIRSVQPGDGGNDLVGTQRLAPFCYVYIHEQGSSAPSTAQPHRISAPDRGTGTARISAFSQATGRPLAFSKGGLWVVEERASTYPPSCMKMRYHKMG
jgi:hypothetical protein